MGGSEAFSWRALRPCASLWGLSALEREGQLGVSSGLRRLIGKDGLVVAPGVFDGLSARLAQAEGFETLYVTGGGIARGSGLPDLGLLAMTEVAGRMAQIADVVDLPLIVDADTGYGNALNVQRTVRAFQRAGVAGLHLEDHTFPKRCGHYADKRVVPTAEFVGKLRAARDALDDPDFLLIARTDAIAVEGFETAIERMERYLEAGADMAFFDAPTSEEQVAEIARRIAAPKLINMFHGGKTPLMPAAQLEALGYRLMIVPGDAQRAAIRAMQTAYAAIRRDGNTASLMDEMAAFEEREAAVDTDGWLARGRRYD
jgi:2-methylisocitrate lyase-like PEP mutase family enzyme